MDLPQENPFGARVQKYWDKRHQYFSRWDEGIQTDAEGLYSVIPEIVAEAQAQAMQGEYVIDAFAGIGGCAIAYARAGKQVTAIEKDGQRLKMAQHNASIYGVADRLTFIHGDFFDVAESLCADTINLDPPWGGPSYKELGKFLLTNFTPDGNELLAFSLPRAHEVILRVPTIFDITELDRYSDSFRVLDDVSNGEIVSQTIVMTGTVK